MREWTIPNTGTASFTFVLFDQFSNQVFANALEPLRAANTFLRRPAYRWQILSLDGQPVTSSAGMSVVPDGPLDSSANGSALILLPSYGYREIATTAMSRILRTAANAVRRPHWDRMAAHGPWLSPAFSMVVRQLFTLTNSTNLPKRFQQLTLNANVGSTTVTD